MMVCRAEGWVTRGWGRGTLSFISKAVMMRPPPRVKSFTASLVPGGGGTVSVKGGLAEPVENANLNKF